MRLGALLAVLLAAPAAAADYGVLLLAEEGGRAWRAWVEQFREARRRETPMETAFGPADPRSLQKSLDALARARVRKILAVPLRLHSETPELDQYRYALGLRAAPPDPVLKALAAGERVGSDAFERVETKLPVAMAFALDDDPLAAEALADRVAEAVRDPAKEAAILVGRGGADDPSHRRRLATLGLLARRVQERTGIAAVHAALLRVDGSREELEADRAALEALARELASSFRVVALPASLGEAGLEKEARAALRRVFHRWAGEPLAPHPAIDKWAARTIEAAKALPNQREHAKPFDPSAVRPNQGIQRRP